MHKPLTLHTSISFVDLVNHIDVDTDYPSLSKYKLNKDGTRTMQYEMIEDRVLKIPFKPGLPKKVKLLKAYTLTIHFDANGFMTGYRIKENPKSPLYRIKRRTP